MNKTINKVEAVRDYILEGICSGKFKAGEPLESARNIADSLNISFISVLNAISSLNNDGILVSSPRRRSYVSTEWRDRILPEVFVTLYEQQPWYSEFKELLFEQSRHELPFKFFSGFKNGTFQVLDTPQLHFEYRDLLDLTPFVDSKYFDDENFFSQAFTGCRINNKLYGIPVIFSPKVVFYNKKLLEEAGCSLPGNDWDWSDFINILEKLKEQLPAEDVINWNAGLNTWLAVILRSGGSIISEDESGRPKVMLDAPETIRGVKLWHSIKDLLNIQENRMMHYYGKDFLAGKKALFIGSRQSLGLNFKNNDFNAIVFPAVPGGNSKITLTSNIFCVRKSCLNTEVLTRLIDLLLSEPVQDFMGAKRQGLPVRKTSAIKSIDFSSPSDTIFLHEIPNLAAEYNFGYREIFELAQCGLERIMYEDVNIDQELHSLAMAIREIFKIKEYSKALK
jgi:ABC-type glycerol-3-phosphate transport system substrate-binding protein/DNA-binding transcriptional regulator YhcF (GntR family)